MKRQASLNYLNKQIWNLKSGSENGTLHRRIVVSSDQPIMDWAKTSLMLRDEKSLYALGIVVASKNGVKNGVESGVAQWTWRRQNGAESGVVKRCRRQASSTKASSTVASSKGVVERRRQQASSTVASRMASSGIEWRRTKSNDVEWRRMASNDVEWHRMTSNAIECHRMLVEYSSNSRRKWRDKILNQNW